MAETEGTGSCDAEPGQVWDYLLELDNWITALDGYDSHEETNDGRVIVTVRGKLGFITKVSRIEVRISERKPPTIAFDLRGLDDPLWGHGQLRCSVGDAGGTDVAYRISLHAHGMAAAVTNEFLDRAVPSTVGDLAEKIARHFRKRGEAPPSEAVAVQPGEAPSAGRGPAAPLARWTAWLRSSPPSRLAPVPSRSSRRIGGPSRRGRRSRSSRHFDIIVVGSGGAGLTTAIVAHDLGARVLVIEKSSTVGGTFAYSTGLVWVPANHHMAEAGIPDSAEEAFAYIRPRTSGRHDDRVLRAFIDHAPLVIEYLERRANVPFEIVPGYPDEQSSEPGGRAHGRYLASPLFHAGGDLPPEWAARLVRSPSYGPLPMSWVEIQEAGGYGSIGRWDWSMLAARVRQDYRAFGMSTAGYLLAGALRRGIPIETSVAGEALDTVAGRVTGVAVRRDGEQALMTAADGVILATGSYDNNQEMKRTLEPHPTDSVVLGAKTVDGSGLEMAMAAGARLAVLGGQLLIPAFHVPGEEAEGEPVYRMLARESGLPGSFIVNRDGKRFCDEATITELRRALVAFDPHSRRYPNLPAYFVFDQGWKERYPLGSVMPGDVPAWMPRADTIEQLGASISVDVATLAQSLEHYNRGASIGTDGEFGRGSTDFGRANGDARVRPNPCLRPLSAPFYAVELRLGIVGNNAGLLINEHGQVLHVRGEPIPGLYAAGNAAANQIGGLWYNAGLMNARGMTFGYLSAHHARGVALPSAVAR